MKSLIKKSVKDLKPYRVIEEEYAIKLDANESPYNIFEEVGPIIAQEIACVMPNRYPDNEATDIKKALANYTGVDEENILCGNGSDELLKNIIDTFVDKGDIVVTHSPSFAMYKIITQIAGGCFLEVEDDENFNIKVDKIIDTAHENDAKVIFLCNPNNPTGRIIGRDNIIRVLDNTKAIVVVDEAYYEFYGETIIDKINDYERLIVLRTLSKAFGLAGLRIGYGIASRETIEVISKVKAPYNLNSISQCIGKTVLDNKEIAFKYIELIRNERDSLYNKLKKVKGIKVIPSKSNFILIKAMKYEELMSRFKKEKILVKGYGTQGILKNCIRLTVGTKDENEKVLNILKEV